MRNSALTHCYADVFRVSCRSEQGLSFPNCSVKKQLSLLRSKSATVTPTICKTQLSVNFMQMLLGSLGVLNRVFIIPNSQFTNCSNNWDQEVLHVSLKICVTQHSLNLMQMSLGFLANLNRVFIVPNSQFTNCSNKWDQEVLL